MVGCLMLLAISCFNVETVRELDFYPVRGGNGIVPARQLLLSDADIVVTEEKKALIYMFCSGLFSMFSALT